MEQQPQEPTRLWLFTARVGMPEPADSTAVTFQRLVVAPGDWRRKRVARAMREYCAAVLPVDRGVTVDAVEVVEVTGPTQLVSRLICVDAFARASVTLAESQATALLARACESRVGPEETHPEE